ncbi:hypothetical protein OF83DRAFT_1136914 [Amylostereum chailletii]|nr:hypothetical protein OF83DRAFT_1136914 [Amylostereum chailletii]
MIVGIALGSSWSRSSGSRVLLVPRRSLDSHRPTMTPLVGSSPCSFLPSSSPSPLSVPTRPQTPFNRRPLGSPSPSHATLCQILDEQRTHLAARALDVLKPSPRPSPQTPPSPSTMAAPRPRSSVLTPKRTTPDNDACAPPQKPKPSPALKVPTPRDFLALFWRNDNRMSEQQLHAFLAPYIGPTPAEVAVLAFLNKCVLPASDGSAFLRPQYHAKALEIKGGGRWHPLRIVWTAEDPSSSMDIINIDPTPIRRRRFKKDTSSLLRALARRNLELKALHVAKGPAQKQLLNLTSSRPAPRKPSPPAAPSVGNLLKMCAHDSPSRAHLRRARKTLSETESKVVRFFNSVRSAAFSKVWLPVRRLHPRVIASSLIPRPQIAQEIVLAHTSPAPRTSYKIETSLMGIKLETSTVETTPDGETVCVVDESYLDV